MKVWTMREIARVAGRSFSYTAELARSGLLPGYRPVRGSRAGAQIPAELAEAYAVVLSVGAVSPRVADVMRDDPSRVIAAGAALMTLGRAALANSPSDGKAA